MRTPLLHSGADSLKYEIREIVRVAKKLEKSGLSIIWENIGDPIAKGALVPQWIKEYVVQASQENAVYGYSPTAGLQKTREYIAHERNLEGGISITADDVFFFNGLGDAISTLYSQLSPHARIIGPNPAYPTHSSAESAHASAPHITYRLNPHKNWEPDVEELERKIKLNANIVGILIINPDNPTGYVYAQDILRQIVLLARTYNLFIISDEIYSNLAYPESGYGKLASVVEDVPAIAMRGISKEFPWPGARCGWLEFYNRERDEDFARYTKSIMDAKMLEVCATTLPQEVLPSVMGDARYYPYLAERITAYKAKCDLAVHYFKDDPYVSVLPAMGAFYMTLLFNDACIRDNLELAVTPDRFALIQEKVQDAPFDQRFVYYLLAATGLCVVPLSTGFNATHYGVRFTLLENDVDAFLAMLAILKEAVHTFVESRT